MEVIEGTNEVLIVGFVDFFDLGFFEVDELAKGVEEGFGVARGEGLMDEGA